MSFFAHSTVETNGYTFGRVDDAAAATQRLAVALSECDAVLIGAGAGLSTAAGFSYSGARFEEHFADFRDAFGIQDMYSGGFYPFRDLETYWAWWSRAILVNRYEAGVGRPYAQLLELVRGRDYFALTTNVDHQFQLAGFDKHKLFYTQGDYGLLQCSRNCHEKTYDNEALVRTMCEQQHDLRVPSELVPQCPVCGAPMVPNLRCDDLFCEDQGWYDAQERYAQFRRRHAGMRVLYLELGVGSNTPVIIKYPFWNDVARNANATYACVNMGEAYAPSAIADRSILIDGDIAQVLSDALLCASPR